MFKFVTGLLCVVVLTVAINCTGCGSGYSEGSRAGTITKFSRKGYLVKSFEGELLMGGLRTGEGGSSANVWDFSVRSKTLVDLVDTALKSGQPVRLDYTEWVVSPFGMDTDYEVVGVTPLDD